MTGKFLVSYQIDKMNKSGHQFHIDIFINANCFLLIIFFKTIAQKCFKEAVSQSDDLLEYS